MRQFQVEYMGDAFAIMKELRRIGDQQRGLGAVQRQMIEYPFPYERDQRLWAGAVAFIMTVRVAELGQRDVPWRWRARPSRSDKRRVGKAIGRTCSSRCAPYTKNKKK